MTSKSCHPWSTQVLRSAQRHWTAQSTPLTKDYTTGGSEAPLSAYAVICVTTERHSSPYPSTPAAERTSFHDVPSSPKEEEVPTADPYAMPCARSRTRSSRLPARHPRRDTISSVRLGCTMPPTAVPRRIRRPVRAWLSRYAMVLEPVAATCMGHVVGDYASIHDVFKVYLPKLLETRRLETFTTSSLKR